tara:strand:+ start:1333 stop:1677 length:345 start_codon:yes stop_codon:yes gene_type:complete
MVANETNKPKTARSYRASVIDDNLSLHINAKWALQVLVLVAGLVYSYLQIENRIAELERRVELSDAEIAELVNKHIAEEEVKIAQMQEQLEWYEKELSLELNPLNWGKKRKKRK